MKRIFPFLLILLFNACEKDSTSVYKMTAFVNGNAWQCVLPVIVIENDKMIITGTALDGKTIIITVNGIANGTYQLSATAGLAQCAALYKGSLGASDDDAYVSVEGSVVLTKVDQINKRVSGTFQFSCFRNLTENVLISLGQINNAKITL
jgi:hypothetical protein